MLKQVKKTSFSFRNYFRNHYPDFNLFKIDLFIIGIATITILVGLNYYSINEFVSAACAVSSVLYLVSLATMWISSLIK